MQNEDTFLIATIAFVAGHFILSSLPARETLLNLIGKKGFLICYSLLSIITFAWMVKSYGNAFYQPIWEPPVIFRFITLFLMLFACFFLVCALTSPNPTLVGGEKLLNDENPNAGQAKGITTISRHPMLVATSLWSVGHLFSNGDLATITLSLGILFLSIGGMFHIDYRRSKLRGSSWGTIALTTSPIPFLASIQGRSSVDWKGIGLWRVLASVILFAALLYGHSFIAGVAIMPGAG